MSVKRGSNGGAGGSAMKRLGVALALQDYDLRFELIKLREERGLSQTQIAEMLGVSQQAISQFEQMDADPRMSTIRRYALAVGAMVEHTVTPTKVK